MADEEKQISDLDTGSITNNNDVFLMDTYEGVTVKIPYSVLKQAVTDGITPSIDNVTKHWFIGSTDTGIVAEGQNGTNGTNGTTPHIDSTSKHWMIGETDTNVVAEGQDGAQGQQGIQGDDGYSVSITATPITGGTRLTISSTDPEVLDQTVDVMDGTEVIQATSDNRTVTLLAADWVGESAPYTQTVAYSGMTALIVPEIGVVISDTVATGLEQQKQWSNITRAVSGTNSITFYCYKTKPTIDLTANVKAV